MGKKGNVWKKVGKIAFNVLIYVFLALGIFSIIISIASKKSGDDAVSIFGYQVRFVQSQSMEKYEGADALDVSGYDIGSIPMKSLVFIDEKPEDETELQKWYDDIKKGDVLTFKYEVVTNRQETITHRVTDKKPNGKGGWLIYLAGDNRASDKNGDGLVDGGSYVPMEQVIDTSNDDGFDYIIGKVTGKSYFLGLVIYALKSPVGIVCIIILPCILIIGLEVIKIIKVLGEDKKKRAKEEQEKTLSELEELKQQLALLQQAQKNSQNDESDK